MRVTREARVRRLRALPIRRRLVAVGGVLVAIGGLLVDVRRELIRVGRRLVQVGKGLIQAGRGLIGVVLGTGLRLALKILGGPGERVRLTGTVVARIRHRMRCPSGNAPRRAARALTPPVTTVVRGS